MKPSPRSQPEVRDLQQLISDRTLQLAKLAGRAPHQIKQADYEQAKCEISGAKAPGAL